MIRQLFLTMAACALLLGGVAYADEPQAEAPPAKKAPAELKTVIVVDATFEDGTKIEDLKREFKIVAEALGHPKATFVVKGETLSVGVDVPGIADGVELERFQFRSDCPDNSQYHVESILADREKATKATVVAWTRWRHARSTAPLRIVRISPVANRKKNFDVQLDLKKVAFYSRR